MREELTLRQRAHDYQSDSTGQGHRNFPQLCKTASFYWNRDYLACVLNCVCALVYDAGNDIKNGIGLCSFIAAGH